MNDYTTLVASVRDVVARAATEISAVAERGGGGVQVKGDRSPVTEADHRSDALLKRELLALLPVAWLSEETADSSDRLDAQRVWVVDPLDGTKEFIAAIPEYAVAVALIEDGIPVMGVVHNPANNEVYWAVRGRGAFKDGTRIQVRDGTRMLASRSERKRGEFEQFERQWDVVTMGSIEYKLALVGAGGAAVTVSRGPKHEWDVAAGALIVEEAGGRVTDMYGDPLSYNQPFPKVKGILAGAPDAYQRVLTELGDIGASDRMGEMISSD